MFLIVDALSAFACLVARFLAIAAWVFTGTVGRWASAIFAFSFTLGFRVLGFSPTMTIIFAGAGSVVSMRLIAASCDLCLCHVRDIGYLPW